jgi:hypothetical protein
MAFSVAVAGTSVQLVLTDGTVTTVTLPTGVTVVSGARPRFAILGKNVIVVNATSEPIWIDPTGTARCLRISAPLWQPTVAAGAAGTLSGIFQVVVRFVVKDADGNDLMVSSAGPESATVTVTNQKIAVSNIPTSSDPMVNCRRLSRTATGPTEEFFEWVDLDDNVTTSYEDDASDLALSLLPDPEDLGAAPVGLHLIVEWKGRLWGVSKDEPDVVYFTPEGQLYAWPAEFSLPVNPRGRDLVGVVGFVPKRDELGIARHDVFWKVIGSNEDDFRMVKLLESREGPKVMVSQDTVVVTRDVGRWLGGDGVYEWNADEIKSISDEDVRPWFSTDTTFNRAVFPTAFARFEPVLYAYQLFLAAAGGTTINRWVSFDLQRRKFLGPHKTGLTDPTAAGVVYDASELLVAALGGANGTIYLVTPGLYRDGAATAIEFDVTTAFFTGGTPNVWHLWKRLSVLVKKIAGGTLSVFKTVGDLDTAETVTPYSRSLSVERPNRGDLQIMGTGKLLKLRFYNNEVDRNIEIYGVEVPYHELGER